MKVTRLFALLLGAALFIASCGDDDSKTSTEPDPEPGPSTDQYEASASVTTTGTGTIATESGAGIQVPLYAVPETDDGRPGTMVFSIEKDETSQPVLADSQAVASDVYRFGPDGFTFAQMVEVTVPLTGDATGKEIGLFRIDPTSGVSEFHGGEYDEETGAVSVSTYHLSPWFVGSYPSSGHAWGAFKITNMSSTHWLNLCVTEYDLLYPDTDGNFDGDAQCTWAPSGHIGWASSGNWFLPQGTYTLCVEMSRSGTVLQPQGENPCTGHKAGSA